jgi:hypothetical protein
MVLARGIILSSAIEFSAASAIKRRAAYFIVVDTVEYRHFAIPAYVRHRTARDHKRMVRWQVYEIRVGDACDFRRVELFGSFVHFRSRTCPVEN